MTFFGILILICSLSFCGIVFLVGFRVYYFRNLKREEFFKDLSLSKPFFYNSVISGKIKTNHILKIFRFNKVWGQGLICWFEKITCRLRNKINGKHKVKCEKCSEYWGKFDKVKSRVKKRRSRDT